MTKYLASLISFDKVDYGLAFIRDDTVRIMGYGTTSIKATASPELGLLAS